MGLLDFLEVEEFVGHQWHRLIGGQETYVRYPEAAVRLEQVRGALGVFFRGLGGARGIEIAAAKDEKSTHRLSFRQRLGMEHEKTMRPTLDDQTLMLPDVIDVFADAGLNRALYYWLAAFFALEEATPLPRDDDPFAHDIHVLRRVVATQQRVLETFPGIKGIWQRLAQAIVAARTGRDLPALEQEVEAVIVHLLGGEVPNAPLAKTILCALYDESAVVPKLAGQAEYHSFLPVPLWGEVLGSSQSQDAAGGEKELGGGAKQSADQRKLRGERRKLDQANREDGFFLHIYDKILSVADMLNVNRNTEDDEEDEAFNTIDDLDRITVSEHDKKAATRIRLDLDLPADAINLDPLRGTRLIPEWDYRRQKYHLDHCKIVMATAEEEGEDWHPDDAARRRIRRVRRQFEALVARRECLRAQPDGEELDLESVVRAQADFQACGVSSNRLYLQNRVQSRDLAISLLVDVSLSTDSWLENRRVIDVEKEALTILGHGLSACGDDFAITTFTSRKRDFVRLETVKGFDEAFSPQVQRRISALKPGYYTRIGAALRSAAEDLSQRPNRQKLLLVITDGKPNDVDHYEGRYGIEDSRKAVQECRKLGLNVFGVTVDRHAQEYFPYIFGRGAYQIVTHVAKLSTALPKIYRQLVNAQ